MKKSFVGKYKSIPFILFLLSVILNIACKTSDETNPPPTPTPKPKGVFIIGAVTGTAIYDSLLSKKLTLKFTAQLFSNDNIGGIVTNWRFIVKKDSNALLEINKDNFNNSTFKLTAYGSSGSYSIPANSSMAITVKHDNDVDISNPFGSIIPNQLDFYVTIMDNNGYEQSGNVNTNFIFTSLF
ncbi:MAG TPA: hypothetical protein VF451_00455 [Acidobacteriota bacterium]